MIQLFKPPPHDFTSKIKPANHSHRHSKSISSDTRITSTPRSKKRSTFSSQKEEKREGRAEIQADK